MSNILLAESHDSVDHIVVVLTQSLHGSSARALRLLHDEGNVIGVQTRLVDSLLRSGLGSLGGSLLLLLGLLSLELLSSSLLESVVLRHVVHSHNSEDDVDIAVLALVHVGGLDIEAHVLVSLEGSSHDVGDLLQVVSEDGLSSLLLVLAGLGLLPLNHAEQHEQGERAWRARARAHDRSSRRTDAPRPPRPWAPPRFSRNQRSSYDRGVLDFFGHI